MREYEITLASKKELQRYYEGYNMLWVSTIEIVVEANSKEEAIRKATGYKNKVVWKVDGEEIWG